MFTLCRVTTHRGRPPRRERQVGRAHCGKETHRTVTAESTRLKFTALASDSSETPDGGSPLVRDDTGGNGGSASGQSVATPLSLDTVFEVLSNRYRRFALYALTDADGDVIELESVIENVATLDAALTESAVTGDQYLEIGTDLYEWHLPVLADVGIIECDARTQEIRYHRDPRLERWLARVRRDELP